jgi:transposase, IS5 family
MRTKIHSRPTFPLVLDMKSPKVFTDYVQQFAAINDILDANPELLSSAHRDWESWGSDNGRESYYSSEQLLRALIVKWTLGMSFRETIVRLADSEVLRNFVRLNFMPVMGFSVLDTAFKKLSGETMHKLNAILHTWASEKELISGACLRLDSTVSECNIHYPTDASLLWDCYRCATRHIERIREIDAWLVGTHRFHVKKAKKLFTFIATHSGARKNKSTQRRVKKYSMVLLGRVEKVADIAEAMIEKSRNHAYPLELCGHIENLSELLQRIRHVIAQSRRAFSGETVPAKERIFSIFEEHTELLKRGKQHKPNEFGHLVQIAQTEEKFISFYEVAQTSRHDTQVVEPVLRDHKEKFGAYPEEFSADKNYYTSMEEVARWEEDIDIFSICKKGNRTADEIAREHEELFRLAQKFRAGIEGSISVLKRVFGLRRCLNRGFNSFATSIGFTVLCHNLVVLSKL